MKKILLLLVLISISLLAFIACDSTKPDDTGLITGIVTDENNEPVEGAKILLGYHFEEIERSETYISFNLEEASFVKAWLTRATETDTVKVLINENLSSGSHNVVWNGKNQDGMKVCNDAYEYHLLVDNTEETFTTFYLLAEYDGVTGENVASYEAMAVTDSKGKYSLSAENLLMFRDLEAIHHGLPSGGVTDELYQISHYAKVWALHADHEAVCVDSVFVKHNKKVKVNLKF